MDQFAKDPHRSSQFKAAPMRTFQEELSLVRPTPDVDMGEDDPDSGKPRKGVELAPDKIRVNCVAPVMGETALLESFMGVPDTPENRAKFIATIPLGRLAKPIDVANVCLYLATDEAEFISGVVFPVDGARTV